MPDAAAALFEKAISVGWGRKVRRLFSTISTGTTRPTCATSFWWPSCEGVGAARFLIAHRPSAFHETWYRNIWDVISRHHLDHDNGGWFEQLDEQMRPSHTLFAGKGDIYHALQACLIPLYPAEGSISKGIIEADARG